MKLFAVVSLLAIVCAAAGLDPSSVINAVQASVGNVQNIAHGHMQKRQTLSQLTVQDVARCTSAIIDYQCGPNGYAQETVNIALGCRNMTAARAASITCARSEGGQTCGSAAVNIALDQTQASNSATCTGAVSSGSCPSSCRSFLQAARSRLGCCVNTYLNTTDSPLYAAYTGLVDYRLWNLCGVDLPASDCGNALPLNPPPNAETCTFSEYFSRLVDYECMVSVGQPFVDAIVRTNRCYPYAVLLADVCGTNANGEFCAQVIGQDVIASETTDPLLASLITCGGTTTCLSSCRQTLMDARNRLGCCVNIYNNSVIDLQFPALSASYWDSCGVETPGFCTSTLNSAAAINAFAWLIVAAMVLVYLL